MIPTRLYRLIHVRVRVLVGRIVYVGRSDGAPVATETIILPHGGVLMPGLWDAHGTCICACVHVSPCIPRETSTRYIPTLDLSSSTRTLTLALSLTLTITLTLTLTPHSSTIHCSAFHWSTFDQSSRTDHSKSDRGSTALCS